ncbi:MAG: amidohydrolase family protein [Cyclobacteriaceae bacterium]
MKYCFLFLTSMLMLASCTEHPHAQLVVTGKIWTGDSTAAVAEAMAVSGDSILAVGTQAEIQKWVGEKTEVVNALAGQLIVPGFIDTHTHFMEGGYQLTSVQLKDARTPAEFIHRIGQFAKTQPAGTWIVGGIWDNENWGGEMPTRDWIDSVTREHPVFVTRYDGHMSLANSLALKAAGVTDRVADIDGGTIVRDRKGRLTGALKDNAADLVFKVIPANSVRQDDEALQAAMNYVASNGVTTIHNMSGGWEAFERAHEQGKLITRIYAGAPLYDWKVVAAKQKGDRWLRYGNLKAYMDGSLGSHTAAFFKAFTDAPRDSGFFLVPPEQIYQQAKAADSAGLHLMIHAIGDKAIHTLLNIFERIEKENGARDRRFRIEHTQHIHPNDIARLGPLGVIASMQPYHAIDDGRFAEKLIGHERCKTTYAFKSLMDAGARVAFGSDWFVAPPTPLEGIYAAVTRRTLDDKNPDGWFPEQKITVLQALDAYTNQGAYAAFEETWKGSLSRGKVADFVLLDQDITTLEPVQIRDVKVLGTWVGGRKVYSRQ